MTLNDLKWSKMTSNDRKDNFYWWNNELMWRLIYSFVTRFFAGKKLRNHPSGIFFSGVNKNLWLQSQVGPTRCTKSHQKTLSSKRYITFAIIALTHYPRPEVFLDFSSFHEAVHELRLVLTSSLALSQHSHAEKNQENLWEHHIGRRKIYSLTIQLHHVKISAKSNKATGNKNFLATSFNCWSKHRKAGRPQTPRNMNITRSDV